MGARSRHPRPALGGLLILLLLGALAAMTFFIDRLDPRTEPTYALVVLVPEAPRLRSNALVWVAGREVGRIQRVDLARPGIEPEDVGLVVIIEVRQHVQEMIRRDSRARVARDRLLGNPGINIVPGSAGEPMLQNGDTLRVAAAVDMSVYVRRAERLGAALDSLRLAARELAPRARHAPDAVRALDDDMARVRRETDLLAGALREGAGASRMREPELRASIDRFRATINEISGLVQQRRLELAPMRDRFVTSLELLREEIARIEAVLAEPHGSVPRLLADPALRESLRETLAEIDRLISELSAEPLRWFF